jgi:hypothetical protein
MLQTTDATTIAIRKVKIILLLIRAINPDYVADRWGVSS